MADLKIKKKNDKNPLLWTVLALVAIVAVIWIIAGGNDDDAYVEDEEIVADPETWGDDSANPGESYILDTEEKEAIEQYVTFTSDLGKIEIDHETSHKGITLLADALASLTNNTQGEVEELRQQARQLLEDPKSEKYAGIMHDAFLTAANIIDEQIAKADTLTKEADEVTKAAQAVDGKVLVTNQKDAIKNFFDKAASALNSLE